MTAEALRVLTAHDERLTVGHVVTVRWTNNHCYYEALGHVTKVNAKSVLVALDVAIRAISPADRALANAGGIIYTAGHVITAPRITDMRSWTANNGTTDAELDRVFGKETL